MSEAPDLFNPGQMKPVKAVTEHVNDDKIVFEHVRDQRIGRVVEELRGRLHPRGRDADGMKKRERMKNMNR